MIVDVLLAVPWWAWAVLGAVVLVFAGWLVFKVLGVAGAPPL